MALLHPFSGTEAKAKEPINEDLTDLKYKENIEDLAAQIDAISGGGSGGAADTGDVGEILLGGETNEAVHWKRKINPTSYLLNADATNPSGFDPEGNSLKNELLTFIESNDTGVDISSSNNFFLGQSLQLAKSSSVSFKLKKGINFFGLSMYRSTGESDEVKILVDGAVPSSLGLTDSNGNLVSDTVNANSGVNLFQTTDFFYGLDGEEHTITIENNDSASKIARIDSIEIGYKSNSPTINNDIHIKSGKANVRGSTVSFNEAIMTFSKTDFNGHTASIVCDSTGTLTALDGECPAMTQVKAEEDIQFSSTVTTLPVKNNMYFPTNGICLLSTPYGNHHFFSYSSKSDSNIQSHSFDDMVWQSQPSKDFSPLVGFTGATAAANGDLNINYWGTAPITVDSTNNKIDFEITIGGVTTVHAATVGDGNYAADLVPIEKAIRKAMQIAKPITGEYHAKYNSESQLWTLYVQDDEVEAFTLLFSTGLNAANSLHGTLGFSNSDFSGALSYLATNEVQHLCCRVLEKDSVYMHSEDPRIKYNSVNNPTTINDPIKDIVHRLGLGTARYLTSTSTNMAQIFVDNDAVGIEVSFIADDNGCMITAQIDDGEVVYIVQPDTVINSTSIRGRLITGLLTFPRGSKKITLRNETTSAFEIVGGTNYMVFAGARQYFTKPAYEKLTKSQAILKTFDVSPINLYGTLYGHNSGALYSPNANDDNINTITESGAWSGTAPSTHFNGGSRVVASNGAYVDVNFTLEGNGGGVALLTNFDVSQTLKAQMFISSTAINESTDLITNTHNRWSTTHYDQKPMKLLGLPSGTYTVRFKNSHGTSLNNRGIVVYDTVSPQANANTLTDINNLGQGISYPINVIRETIQRDSNDRVPVWLERSGYKEGRVSLVNYSFTSPTFTNRDDAADIVTEADQYGSRVSENVSGNSIAISGFFKSIVSSEVFLTNQTTNVTSFINGVQTLNSHSQRVQVKGGSAPSNSGVRGSKTPAVQKEFFIECSFSAGDTFNVSDTRGMKVNQVILLDDGTNKELAVIASIVVGVSFTVKKARTTVVDANVTIVEFQGFHTFRLDTNDTSIFQLTAFEYEPLKITHSKALSRNSDMVYEKVTVTFNTVSNNDDLYYPVHSDGVVGNWTTSTIEVIGLSNTNVYYIFDQDLKDVTVDNGSGGGNIDVKITSERLVPKLNEKDRF